MSKFANKFTRNSMESSLIIDTAAKHDDRQFWDLGTREDQDRSAPCISSRTLLHPAREKRKSKLRKRKKKRDSTPKRASKRTRDS